MPYLNQADQDVKNALQFLLKENKVAFKTTVTKLAITGSILGLEIAGFFVAGIGELGVMLAIGIGSAAMIGINYAYKRHSATLVKSDKEDFRFKIQEALMSSYVSPGVYDCLCTIGIRGRQNNFKAVNNLIIKYC